MIKLLETIIPILIQIESGGDPNALGDFDSHDVPQAAGILQIHKICVRDVNRIYDTTYTSQDRFSVEKSINICKLYLLHYGNENRLGHKPTPEDLARIWNGGPNGWKKKSTLPYWEKCKTEIERKQNEQRQNNK